ncbi:MAG: hypothetical protein V4736_12215 [Bdellovibrionota bacterium]
MKRTIFFVIVALVAGYIFYLEMHTDRVDGITIQADSITQPDPKQNMKVYKGNAIATDRDMKLACDSIVVVETDTAKGKHFFVSGQDHCILNAGMKKMGGSNLILNRTPDKKWIIPPEGADTTTLDTD